MEWSNFEYQSISIFLLVFILLQPLGVPGFLFVSYAVQRWPPHVSLGVSLLGGVLAALNGFYLSRFLAREWVTHRIPARFKKVHDVLSKGDFRAALQGHLLFYMAPPLSWFFGLSAITTKDFTLGCVLGITPGTVLILIMSYLLPGWVRDNSVLAVFLNMTIAMGSILIINLLMKLKMKKSKAK